MRKARFSEERMILHGADKAPVARVAKQHGISEQTLYVWRKLYGKLKLEAADVKELRACSRRTARLKKLLAERDLAIEMIKEINEKKMVSAPRTPTTRSGTRKRVVCRVEARARYCKCRDRR